MSRPPLKADKTASGIAVDPITLDRVIPESRRADGSIRKQLKIRPGFTPQEDVKRFRGTRQAQMDANALPKGHIIGWAPPPSAKPAASGSTSGEGLSKSAKKNAKKKEKRNKEKEEAHTKAIEASLVPDSWEDDDEPSDKAKGSASEDKPSSTSPPPAPAEKPEDKDSAVNDLAEQASKLNVN